MSNISHDSDNANGLNVKIMEGNINYRLYGDKLLFDHENKQKGDTLIDTKECSELMKKYYVTNRSEQYNKPEF